MLRLGRIFHPRPSHSTIITAGATVAAGAITALVMVAPSAGPHRQPFLAADATASGRSAFALAGRFSQPAQPAVQPGLIDVTDRSALARRFWAERRADARQAARRRAERAAASQPPAAPPATPAPPPVTSTGYYSVPALEKLWVSAGGPSWAAAQAASIAMCESNGNPRAYNPSGASGLWQILGQVVPGNIFDPMVNAENAVAKFRASGDTFAQWVC